ncbi:MAG: metal ABC transporter ATP-binding protein [Candidatus Helarchaeota archaeon]
MKDSIQDKIEKNTQPLLIEIQNLSVAYQSVIALHDVNLNIHKGEHIGITGPNASGKTTLLKSILGIVKPFTGFVKIYHQNIFKSRLSKKMRHKIAYVPQSTAVERNFPALVEEVVMMGRYAQIGVFRPITPKDKAIVEDALRHMKLFEFAKRPIGHLSGGQQQKVLIARALAQEPEILLLDEPTSSLDFKIVQELGQLIEQLHKTMHLTIIEVNHNLNLLRNLCDRLIVLNGTIVWQGPADSPEFDTAINETFLQTQRIKVRI